MSNLNLNTISSLDTGREVDVNRVMQTVDYVGGLVIDSRDTVIADGDDRYVLSSSTAIPYTTTGAGMPEGGAFQYVGDAKLRGDLVQLVATFDSVAGMVNATGLTIGRKVRTLGYYNPGDGGGNDYEIVAAGTGTDDGGSFIDLSGSGLQAKGLFVNGQFSALQFGARGDGVTDNAAAISHAMQRGGVLLIPAGVYRIASTVTGPPTLLVGDGSGNTQILFDDLNGADGIAWTEATKYGESGGAVGIELIARGSNGGAALKMPKAASNYNTHHTRWIFHDIYCRGDNRATEKYSFAWDFGFSVWLRLSDCTGLDVDNITIQGQWDIKINPAGQFQDCGIELDSDSAMLSARITHVNIGPIHTGIRVGNRSFFSLSEFDIIGSHIGIGQSGTFVFNEPKISYGNINAQAIGIVIRDSNAIDITSVTIRRHTAGWRGATNAWYGISLTNSSSTRIAGCLFQPDESDGEFLGPSFGISAQDCSSIVMDSNIPGLNLDQAFSLSNVAGAEILNTTLAGLSGVYVRLRNNCRRINISKPSISETTANYTLLSDDGSIDFNLIYFDDRFQELESNSPFQEMIETGNVNNDDRKWTTIVDAGVMTRRLVDSTGTTNSFEIVRRTGTNTDSIEWRADEVYLNASTVRTRVVRPTSDNVFSLGTAANRWGEIFAGNGTISTSDEREKHQARTLSDAEKAVAVRAKALIRAFKWGHAIENKGDAARWHFGVMAQELGAAFESEGLDPHDYGMFCYDEWPEQDEILKSWSDEYDESGNLVREAGSEVVREYRPAGNRYGVRYEELLAFIIAAL